MFLGETDLTEPDRKVTVNVKYEGIEQMFTGDANAVWVSVNRFFGEHIPTFDLARKVTLTIDLAQLIEDFKEVITIAPEGPELLIPKDKLTDSEVLQFYLLAGYIGFRLGKRLTDVMTKEELQAKLGKSMKITATRLGELVKQGTVVKTEEGSFKIATIGIRKLQEELTAIKAEVW
jgi:hypothetical protein